MKMYVNMKDLNEYEREHNRISYARLVDRLFSNMVLCNEIVKDYEDFEIIAGSDYDEENDYYEDIYQYYIVDGSVTEETLEKIGDELGIVYYDHRLEVYVLGVMHFGTSWDYVLTDIKPTDKFEDSI